MDIHEQDELETLKAWWAEYGRPILIGIVVAVVGIGGWNFWDAYQVQRAEEASSIFYQMMDDYDVLEQSLRSQFQGAAQPSDEDKLVKLAAFKQSAESLKEQYGTSEYAHYARLHLAKYHVLDGDLEQAEQELRGVLANRPNANMRLLGSLRLARVLAANGKDQEALTLTEIQAPGTYGPDFLELRGDIYFRQGDMEKALAAYDEARSLSAETDEQLDMKYYNLLSD